MSKTNFTKVEEALTEGMRRIEVKKLDSEAKAKQQAAKTGQPTSVPVDAATETQRRCRRQALKLTLKFLLKHDKSVFSKLKTTQKEAMRLLSDDQPLSDFDHEMIELILTRASMIKKEIEKKTGTQGDEDLVDQQRTKHLTKRFNVNDKWLPLK